MSVFRRRLVLVITWNGLRLVLRVLRGVRVRARGTPRGQRARRVDCKLVSVRGGVRGGDGFASVVAPASVFPASADCCRTSCALVFTA